MTSSRVCQTETYDLRISTIQLITRKAKLIPQIHSAIGATEWLFLAKALMSALPTATTRKHAETGEKAGRISRFFMGVLQTRWMQDRSFALSHLDDDQDPLGSITT
jgi:hypothetical protein